MQKLVREIISINEKFTEDSTDPINDMGIGGFSFETLRPGAVLRARVNVSIAIGDKGTFTYMGSGIDMPAGNCAIVLNSRNYVLKDHKEIKVYVLRSFLRSMGEKEVADARERLKVDPGYTGWGVRTRLIINKKIFNNKFDVIEKGF